MQVRCQVLPSGFEQRIPANRKIYSWLWRCAPTSVSWQVQKPQSHGPSDGNISSHIQDNHSPDKIDWSAVRSRLQVEASGPESRPGTEHPELNLALGNQPMLKKDCSPLNELSSDALSADELWMEEALRCAQRALEAGEVPVGAVVVCEGRVVGRGWNRNLTDYDPTAHAEIVALREAGRNVANPRLVDCELFTTIEPCAMCAGAAVHARVRRLVYGADDPKAGAIHSILQVVNHPSLNHQMDIRGGVLAGRSAEMLQEFFRKRR